MMENTAEGVGLSAFASMQDSLEPFLADGQIHCLPVWKYDSSNIDLPLYLEQPHNPLAYPSFSGLLSPITAGQFAVPMRTSQFGNSYAPVTTPTADLSAPSNLGLCQLESRCGRTSSTMTLEDNVFASQLQDPAYLTPYDLLCSSSREYEPHPAPLPPSFPSVSQPLSSLPTHPCSDMQQQYDAYAQHVLRSNVPEAYTSPDEDNAPSPSGKFLAAFADYDFSVDAGVANHHLQSSAGPLTYNSMLIHSATLPSSDSDHSADRHASRRFECRWSVSDGAHCQSSVVANRRSVIHHLHYVHGIEPGDEKARQKCQWEHCETKLNRESLARHILTVHLKEKVKCTECGELFAREDSLRRHLNLKGSQHHVPPPCKPREGATVVTRKRDSHH